MGVTEFQLSYLKILKDDAVKVLYSICQQIWKTQQWPQDWKRSVFIPIPKKGSAKEILNYWINVLISHASKVMLKILQVRLQQYVNQELLGVQARSRKGRETSLTFTVSSFAASLWVGKSVGGPRTFTAV